MNRPPDLKLRKTRLATLLGFCAALMPVVSAAGELAERRLALDGQCALGWVYGHRILTDCKIVWRDPREDLTYCFTTATARKEFLEAVQDNANKAREHFQAAQGSP